ncbi:hypothetical protein HBE96_03130 [Clostridium sp. P21]|uniref:Uncharacterized protein n=1 Tax=Clostridium muellerianum TaxID=2716538 RepID=A0A7Y0HNK6_9CLOT|nr:hypothetical protein [Clostridium muellerianum]NMM61698.1 hypothetical protein [Clostridium muellerianum]
MEKEKLELGNPAPTMLFIFTMITMMFWAQYMGIVKPEAQLLLGLFQLGCFPAYLIGGITFLKKGDSISGNTYLIFATIFGGLSGFGNTGIGIASFLGWPVDTTMLSIPILWSGIIVIPILICIRYADALTFVVFTCGSLLLILSGLVGLSVFPTTINPLITILCFIVAVGGLYISIATICSFGGVFLPLGKPLFKNKYIEESTIIKDSYCSK